MDKSTILKKTRGKKMYLRQNKQQLFTCISHDLPTSYIQSNFSNTHNYFQHTKVTMCFCIYNEKNPRYFNLCFSFTFNIRNSLAQLKANLEFCSRGNTMIFNINIISLLQNQYRVNANIGLFLENMKFLLKFSSTGNPSTYSVCPPLTHFLD